MISVAADSKIAVVNPFNYSIVTIIYDHRSYGFFCVRSLGANSGYFATGGANREIKIWDTSMFRFVRRIEGHAESINSLIVLSNGYLASGSNDYTIRVWDPNTGMELSSYNTSANVNFIKQLDNGIIAASTKSSFMYFVNMSSAPSLMASLEVGMPWTGNIWGMALADKGKLLVVAWDQSLTIINTSTYSINLKTDEYFSFFCLENYQLSKTHFEYFSNQIFSVANLVGFGLRKFLKIKTKINVFFLNRQLVKLC